MPDKESAFHDLTADDFDKIRALASPKRFRKDELVFSEGDVADNIYFIESGKVSVRIQKFADQEEIATLGPGEYFGEMAFFDNGKRNASIIALTDANLLSVSSSINRRESSALMMCVLKICERNCWRILNTEGGTR
jgi:CRP-like cAMP-binding protein